jgi:amino acid adenylation domain-containing protein
MLGILAAGATWVPLDPDAPAERYDELLRLSDARNLSLAEVPEVAPPASTFQARHPQSAAYVIFTSGSTGTPKGVLIPRSVLAHYTESALRTFAITPADRVLQFSSLAFDACIEEIFPALASEATLVLAPATLLDSFSEFLNFCATQRITILDLPTAFWHELVAVMSESGGSLPPSVRLVIIGGEPASATRVAAWGRIAPAARLINTYGPTETTVVAVACDLSRSVCSVDPRYPAPIGTAMPGVTLRVLDDLLNPTSEGMSGDLYIAGPGLARGYLDQPAATAAFFLPDPFSCFAGARMYRTGDRVRVNLRGELEFLGRTDAQIKVRGFRVEATEIERVLATCPGVARAAVATVPEGDRVKLVACAVPAPGTSLSAASVRDYLSGRLPQRLIPTVSIMDRVPKRISGKVDGAAIERAAPRTPVDDTPAEDAAALLLSVWSGVLDTPVQWRANFFDLGGNSLSALRLGWALGDAFNREVPVRTIFEYPTPAALHN